MTFGELFGNILGWLYDLWPLVIVNEWEQGVRYYRGKSTKLLRAGLHWYIPLLGEIIVRECNTETIETSLQTVTTSDGVEATFALAVKLKVTNLRRCCQRIHSPTETTANEIMGRAMYAAAALDYDMLQDKLGPDVLKLSRGQLQTWGIQVIEVTPTTLSRAQAIRLIFDRSISAYMGTGE